MSKRVRQWGLFAACLVFAASFYAFLKRPSQEEQLEALFSAAVEQLARMKPAQGIQWNGGSNCYVGDTSGRSTPALDYYFDGGSEEE